MARSSKGQSGDHRGHFRPDIVHHCKELRLQFERGKRGTETAGTAIPRRPRPRAGFAFWGHGSPPLPIVGQTGEQFIGARKIPDGATAELLGSQFTLVEQLIRAGSADGIALAKFSQAAPARLMIV